MEDAYYEYKNTRNWDQLKQLLRDGFRVPNAELGRAIREDDKELFDVIRPFCDNEALEYSSLSSGNALYEAIINGCDWAVKSIIPQSSFIMTPSFHIIHHPRDFAIEVGNSKIFNTIINRGINYPNGLENTIKAHIKRWSEPLNPKLFQSQHNFESPMALYNTAIEEQNTPAFLSLLKNLKVFENDQPRQIQNEENLKQMISRSRDLLMAKYNNLPEARPIRDIIIADKQKKLSCLVSLLDKHKINVDSNIAQNIHGYIGDSLWWSDVLPTLQIFIYVKDLPTEIRVKLNKRLRKQLIPSQTDLFRNPQA